VKRREVILSPRAKADLVGVYEFLVRLGHPQNAIAYVDRLAAFCHRLDVASERGHRRDDISHGLRIVGFERRVTIAFTVDDERVTVLRLFYGGQDWKREFEGSSP
jgi:toxin ParE1/3/4